jgi:hypothetical protein
MERLIDPVIADIQAEYDTALRRGSKWNRYSTRAAGYLAFGKAVMLFSYYRLGKAVPEWMASDEYAMGRVAGFTAAAMALVITVMDRTALLGPTRMLPALLLQAVPFAIAVALPCGILLGLRGRNVTNRVRRATLLWAFGCSVAAFVTMGWLAPWASQALFPVGRPGFPPPSLSLTQVLDRIRDGERFSHDVQVKLSFSLAPLVLGWFALRMSTLAKRPRSVIAVAAVAVATAVLYDVTMVYFSVGAIVSAAMWTVWIPNIMFTGGAMLMVRPKPNVDVAPE